MIITIDGEEVRKYKNILVDRHGYIYSTRTFEKRKPQLVAGYHYTTTGMDAGTRKTRHERVHRIVASLYIPNPDDKLYVNHINGNKLDNRVLNLEWCTMSENHRHAFKTGIRSAVRGSKAGGSKLKESDIPEIFKMRINLFEMKDIAKKFGIGISCVSAILNRRTWTHVHIEVSWLHAAQGINLQKKGTIPSEKTLLCTGVYHSANLDPGNP